MIKEAVESGEPIRLIDDSPSSGVGIKRYREMRPDVIDEADLIAEAKELSNKTGRFIDKVEKSGHCDKRWLSIARTDLQKAYMSLIRSIERPNHF